MLRWTQWHTPVTAALGSRAVDPQSSLSSLSSGICELQVQRDPVPPNKVESDKGGWLAPTMPCLHTCMQVYIHTLHVCVHVYTLMTIHVIHTHAPICTCMYTDEYTHQQTHLHPHTYALKTHTSTTAPTCTCLCTHGYIYHKLEN